MTAPLASALLHLYPRAWRQRYAPEMRELLAAQRLSLRTLADIVAGAIDARLNPQVPPAAAPHPAGARTMTKSTLCRYAGVSVQDQWRSAGWMVGGSIVLTLMGIGLQLKIGPNALSEGLMYAAVPASLMLSSECTYLKRYSRAARTMMSIGGALVVILTTWAAVAIGYRI